MTLLGSGNVGIGTINPTDVLHVHKNTGSFDIVATTLSTSQAGIRFGTIGATYQGRVLYDNPTNSLAFYTNGTERARIDSTGNFGLGVTPPTQNGGTGIWFTKGTVITDGNSFYPGVHNAYYNS